MSSARPIGSHELQRAEAQDLWNDAHPENPAVAVQWAGGDRFLIVPLHPERGCKIVDLSPAPEGPAYQLRFDALADEVKGQGVLL